MKSHHSKPLHLDDHAVFALAILAATLFLLLPFSRCMAEAPKSAEAAGWTLSFRDDFDRNELGANWVVLDGDWAIKENSLRGRGTLISAKGFPPKLPPGFLRLEFDATTDVKPIILSTDSPTPKESVGDIGSILHARPQDEGTPAKTGYFFQFGGRLNTVNLISKEGLEVAADSTPENMIVQDKRHHIVVENDQGTLRMVVDGKVLLEEEETTSIFGQGYDRIGFNFLTTTKIDNVKVYAKRLPNDLDMN